MKSATPADIAIIGMSCTFPGARDLRQYWKNIVRKVDAVGDPNPDWEPELFYDPESPENDRTYCRRGGYLGQLAEFAPGEFGVMPQSVDGAEPDHFLALRAAAEAMADSGYKDRKEYRDRTAVIVGRGTYVNRGNTTAIQHGIVVDSVLRILLQLHPEHSDEEIAEIRRHLKQSLPPFNADTSAGLVPNIITGRIANRLDLMGPNYVIDAACASSIIAVDLAMRELQTGRCDMAIAGGVHASTTPVILIIFSHLKALSRKGQIRPFDSEADGTLLGEGVGMVVLRRLADAERDGDRVYAVLKGVGVSSDGRALGLLAPRLEGEEAALRRAYEAVGFDPATVHLVEAHGTATPAGDAVEIDALKKVFGGRKGDLPRCALGSVKSMISHTMPASGMAGLIKTALALHHKVLPPTLHCETPNPKLELESSNFYINTETRPWIHGGPAPRRAAVNSFGFGGVNSHAILEEYTGVNAKPPLDDEWDTELFVVAAPTPAGLPAALALVRELAATAAADVPLKDLAFTVSGRGALSAARIAIIATSREDLIAKLDRASNGFSPEIKKLRDQEGIFYFADRIGVDGKLALMFPGEGAQYPNMLADLCIHFPEVRQWFDLVDGAFLGHPRGYFSKDTVFPRPGAAAQSIWSMDVGAEAVFTANEALYALLQQFDLKPAALVGHSTGENTALLAAGVVQASGRDQLVRHILGVNRVFENLQTGTGIPDGVLLAIAGISPALIETLLSNHRGELFVALDNCPNQMVLCGLAAAVDEALRSLADKPVVCQRLAMGRAYHTPYFREFSASLRAYFDELPVAGASPDLYSCVTADRYPNGADAIRELAANQWSSTVRFRETIEAMYRDGVRIFVECGPRGNLTSFVDDILRGRGYAAIPANVQHRSGIRQLQHLLGTLLALGVDVNLDRLYRDRNVAVHPSAANARKPRTMKIASGLQPIRLPASFHTTNRPTPPAAQPTVPAAAPPLAAAAAMGATSESAVLAMQRHMASMANLVQSQQAVLMEYMRLRGGAAGPRPSPVHAPFATEIAELVPGSRARVRHTFSLERDRLFLDHTLGRNVSEADPELLGVPVVPFTITMEMLAEAAAVLAPGRVLAGMRDVRSSHWVSLEKAPLTVEMTAETLPEPGAIRVIVRPVTGEKFVPSWAEGVMLFADRYPQAPRPAEPVFQAASKSAWAPEQLYVDGMFHGPSFQVVRRMERSGSDGAVATFQIPPRQDLIASLAQPAFLTDPVALDAAGQAVAFWSQEKLQAYGDIFPFRMMALHCFGPPSEVGATLECRVFVVLANEREIHSNIEIVDTAGRLLYRIEGWQDRRFLLPRPLWDLRISSGASLLSRDWPEPIAHPNPAESSCCIVDQMPDDLLSSSHGIWESTVAHLVLGREERAIWNGLRGAAPKRRYEWLRGRCAAKDAVRRLVSARTGRQLRAADVHILPDAWGKPLVRGHWIADSGMEPAISLAHSGGVAVALAHAHGNALVGIDVESRAPDPDGFERLAFDAGEQQIIAGLAADGRKEWLLRLWCAKEAAVKALGHSFEQGLHSVAVVGVDLATGAVSLRVQDGLLQQFPGLARKVITAQTVCTADLVLSTILSKKDLSQ